MNNQLNNDQGGKQPDNKDPKNQGSNKNHQSILAFLICLLVTLVCFALFTNMLKDNSSEISYDKFIDMVDKDQVKEVTIQSSTLTIVPKKKNSKYEDMSYYTTKTEDSTALTKRLEGKGIKFETDPPDVFGEFVAMILSVVLPTLLLFGLLMFSMRRMNKGGGIMGMGVGKSKAKAYVQQETGVSFKDVAGQDEAKESLQEVVDFLHNPGKYTAIGAKLPKGALLVGPPGTGKTLLAKAVAGEANVPFFSLSGSDFVEMFVGVGASRVRDLFRQAKEKSPCIVFIDEIDAVGRARGKNANMNSNDERENTLNQLLTEMDGFGSNSGVIILAATNRADILDKALLRAGRFDRQIHVELPDLNERKEIFGVHLRPIKIDESVDAEFLARQTPGFSGADIANVCNEAALIAARNGKKFVQKEDFMNAVDRIVGGLEKRSKITTEEERKCIANHEAGHATLSWLLEHANPLVKVTIVPRGKALGAAWYLPEERQITTREQLQDEMCATLGGRAAEELVLGKISTGASNDLERVTKQAYAMVVYFGMSDKLPNLNYYDSTGQDWGFTKPYSEETAKLIDTEVQKIINEQYDRAKRILSENKEGHSKLAQVLLDREVIYSEDVEHIFGKRAWISRSQEILELQEKANGKNKENADKEAEADATTENVTDTPTEENKTGKIA